MIFGVFAVSCWNEPLAVAEIYIVPRCLNEFAHPFSVFAISELAFSKSGGADLYLAGSDPVPDRLLNTFEDIEKYPVNALDTVGTWLC